MLVTIKIEINGKQFSEAKSHIDLNNTHAHTDFWTFINRFRVNMAKLNFTEFERFAKNNRPHTS